MHSAVFAVVRCMSVWLSVRHRTGLLQLCSGRGFMFIFSDSSLCRTRQPAWPPWLIATTTSRRFLLACTAFQYANESSTRRRCLYGSVYMMQPLAIWLTCVSRRTPCMVASKCVPRRLGLCWSRAPGLLPVSAASPNMEQSASRS